MKEKKQKKLIEKDKTEKVNEFIMDVKVKKALYIIIFLITVFLSLIMSMQFKTVDVTNIATIEAMREVELKEEIAASQKKVLEKREELKGLKDKLKEYEKEIKDKKSAPELISKELEEAKQNLGYLESGGEGISFSMEDSKGHEIESMDILMLLNQLKDAGATALSVNGERIVTTTEVVAVDGYLIYINGKKQLSPYVIKALGDSATLEAAITTKGGIINQLRLSNKTISNITKYRDLKVPKYTGEISTKYITK